MDVAGIVKGAGRVSVALACMMLMMSGGGATAVSAQGGRGRGPAGPPPTAKAAALIDITGYWVSVVNEDWRWRMVTPAKGDYASVPLNAEGRRVADTWDLAKDEAAGDQCKAYGAAGLIRVPGRLHITWDDDTTLRMEFDAGTQTRLLRFGDVQPPSGEPELQGVSMATWQKQAQRRGFGQAPQSSGGALKVVTTNLRAGYLRKNGVPYSDKTLLTEYFDRLSLPGGDSWLIVTTTVEDPKYLNQTFIISSQFKREADGSKWHPSPCHTDPPTR